MRYTFENTNLAAQRLKRIADFFNPLSGEFIRKHTDSPISVAVDLGCGPGYSTEMLAQASAIPEKKRQEISDELHQIFSARAEQSNITWKMKRIILTR